MFRLCAPALIYVAFSLTQIIIDTFKGLYNTAFFKAIVMIIITILLNALCQAGMGIVSWIIVFIPFIFMSIIVAILLYVFGLNPSTGKLNIECNNCNSSTNGKVIHSSTIKSQNKTVTYSETPLETTDTINSNVPFGSSDPEYE